MAKSKSLSVDEALDLAAKAEMNLDAFEQTAPETVKRIGGRDALARVSENTCVGPLPRLDLDTWLAMSAEYEDRRQHGDLAEQHRSLTPGWAARRE